MRRSIILSFLCIVALSSSAQQAPQPSAPYGETIEVRIMNVDVVVTDRSGRAVGGLTKDDFELFDNEQKVDIANFFAANELEAGLQTPEARQQLAVQATPQARRHFVVFLDNTTIEPSHRRQVMPQLRAFIDKSMRPGDDIMIAEWNNSLSIPVQLTPDKAAALAAIDKFSAEAMRGMNQRAQLERAKREIRDTIVDGSLKGHMFEDGPTPGNHGNKTTDPDLNAQAKPPSNVSLQRPLGIARTFAEDVMMQMRTKSGALKSVVEPLSPLEGKKVVIFLTESFSAAPAREMFEFLDSIKERFVGGGEGSTLRTEAQRYQDSPFMEEVATAANLAGASLYPISTRGSEAPNFVDATLDGPVSTDAPPPILTNSKASEQVLQDLATATGGVAIINTSNFASGFDSLASDLSHYYSLGYKATGDPTAVHRISVRLRKGGGYMVRTREAYVHKASGTQMEQAVTTNLTYPVRKNDLRIAVTADAAKQGPLAERMIVPVEIRIPTEALTLVPDGTDLTGHFSIYAAFFRKDGAVSPVSKQEQSVRFPAESLKRRKEITVKLAMEMDRTTETMSIGVIDETSQTSGFASVPLAR